ncbi:hypothetical protein [Aeoliella sp.]|uniref:hypothetical protein n=1 Tax=Aeoliella sp. TaxID=2795800 RepID=UPI003CCBCF7C
MLNTSGHIDPEWEAVSSLTLASFNARFEFNRMVVARELGESSFEGRYVGAGFSKGKVLCFAGWTYPLGHVVLVQHDEGDLGAEATLDLRIVKRGPEEVPRFPLNTTIYT